MLIHYSFLIQDLREARRIAAEIAHLQAEETHATRAQVHINELEGLLYSRAKTAPRPKPAMTDAQKKIANMSFDNKNAAQVLMDAASKSTYISFFLHNMSPIFI